ncbi:hypothetical protein GCM10009554_05010 [Kribbella koreensis]|uniref:TIR domain-containing protein n=1 Tax=Kribbella koreensis TaxID=57909 RepID=A0ABN1PBQ1_9ACTN
MASALGFDPIFADKEAPANPRDKVLELMRRCQATIFVADLDKEPPSSWQSAELGYALSLSHHIAFIYASAGELDTDLHLPARDIEPLRLTKNPTSTENHIAIASYLSSLKDSILRHPAPERKDLAPLRYDSVVWSVHVDAMGHFKYNCRFECVAQADNVGDLDHWMNRNPRLPDPIEPKPRSVELIPTSDQGRVLTLRSPSGDDRVFRFGWEIDPPLKYGDRLSYVYQVSPNNGPITREWWNTRQYPIMHMYNVTLPMHSLRIAVTSDLGVGFSVVDAKAYVGQRMDNWTENRRESARTREGIYQLFAGDSAVASIDVNQPLMGHTYALEWGPDWS